MKKYFALMFFAAFAGGLIAVGTYNYLEKRNSDQQLFNQSTIPSKFTGNYSASINSGCDFVQAAEMTVHAVVNIKTEFQRRTTVYDDFFGFFGNPYGNSQILSATGSGVIISNDGYIVTNNHVVQEADKIEVTLNDKRIFNAKIIATDPSTDLALLKIDASELPTVVFGNSDEVKIGEWVLAVGNPFNLTSTVTAGIVSAKARNINILGKNSNQSPIESFIQTDAAVNPGNSGGALVNTKGELVGINAAIASNTGSYSGYSFAIPVNIVRKVTEDLKKFGIVQRAYLGVSIAEIDGKLAENKKLNNTKGIYIGDVIENGAAAQAGIKEGDIISSVNGKQVNSNSELLEAIGQYRPSDKIVISVVRNDKPVDFTVTLQNQNGKTDLILKEEKQTFTLLGANFEVLSNDALTKYNLNNGIMISKLNNSVFRNAGIREGFIITEIDKKAVKNLNDLKNYTNKKGQTLVSGTYPGDWRTYYFILNL
ncbi:MAG: Do family serine endopeptidase [Bacteroidetes bacterium]|nr:Do family serine endopeptidase [Bacteroidota bacterium]